MALPLSDPEPLRGFTWLAPLAASVAFIGSVALAAFVLGYTGRDDSHITYFVSDALAAGEGIVNYNGEAVEQSSTLAFAALLGLIVWISGLPAPLLGPFVSCTALLVALGLAMTSLRGRAWGMASCVAFLSPPSLYWAFSGMENAAYLAVMMGLVLALSGGPPLAISALAGLATLTRPEAPFVVLAALGFLTLYSRIIWPGSSAALAGIVAAFALRLGLGLDLFPNTVHAKQTSGSWAIQVKNGLRYLERTAIEIPFTTALLLPALIALVVTVLRRQRGSADVSIVVMAALGGALLLFPIAAGGDWMEAGRFLSAAYPLLFLSALLTLAPRPRAVWAAVLTLAIVADTAGLASRGIGGVPLFAARGQPTLNYDPAATERFNRVHVRDISFVDKAIPIIEKAYFEEPERPVVIASIQAGMVPYYLFRHFGDRIYFVDLLGLSTDHVHDCRGDLGWRYDPYKDLSALEDCIGTRFDLVFDLESGCRVEEVRAQGCIPRLIDETELSDVPWKSSAAWTQFLADCRGR